MLDDLHASDARQPTEGQYINAMLELAEIATLEERRAAQAMSEIADECLDVGGGKACRSAPGAWVNAAIGIGLNEAVEKSELSAVTAWYESIRAEPRFEVSPYAHDSVIQALGELGYIIRVFESVFFRELQGALVDAPQPAPAGLKIRAIDPENPELVRHFAETITRQFYPLGTSPSETDLRMVERSIRQPRTTVLGAWLDDRLVAGGGMEISGGVAALFGLAVVEEYRRRGIQQALIAARLRLAQERGAKVAIISSRPRVATERNVRRMGFQLAYTKVILVRPGEGLAPVVG
jgi:GNAT superfamily N-acetyltransferase